MADTFGLTSATFRGFLMYWGYDLPTRLDRDRRTLAPRSPRGVAIGVVKFILIGLGIQGIPVLLYLRRCQALPDLRVHRRLDWPD